MARNFWRFDKNLGQVPASAQATDALTYMAPGMGVPDGYVASATNVRLSEYRFIQPRLVPVKSGEKITDVKVEYPDDFVRQQIEYGDDYSFLPTFN